MILWELLEAGADFANAYGGEDLRQEITWGELLPNIAALMKLVQREVQIPRAQYWVENERPYDWYVRQEGTGPDSDNNCMPAATAMILRWLQPERDWTAETLRQRYPLEGAGWRPEEVENIFRQEGVSFATPPISLSSMLQALDAGHILLVLTHEGNGGHCLVVKGYLREGDGIWMLTHDPSSPYRNAYGEYVGKNRRIEAGALLRSMENHWWLYFEIHGMDNEAQGTGLEDLRPGDKTV